MDDPDAMAAVGKVWVHWLEYYDGADKDQILTFCTITWKDRF